MVFQEPCVFVVPPEVGFPAADIVHTVKERDLVGHTPVFRTDGVVMLKKAELIIHANWSPVKQ
jgi:hypothetical protein